MVKKIAFSKKIRRIFLRELDRIKLSAYGIVLATKKRSFIFGFIISFIFFGTLLNLLSSGLGTLDLFARIDFWNKCAILWSSFSGIFGVNRQFTDWILFFLTTFLQSILIGLVYLLCKYRKDTTNLQNTGIITGLVILSSGCPTCGTTVLTPLIVSIIGVSGMALAGKISIILTFLSIIIILIMLRKIGFEIYAILITEKINQKKGKNQ